MKIKSVYLSNFKNFEGNHIFDLNENINIFYAENGFGKSSFFDALEWCLTGEINRFNEFNDEDIINYNINDSHVCSVKIEFANGSIERYLNVENSIKKGKTQVRVKYEDRNGKIVKVNGKKYINNLIRNKDCLGINSLNNLKQTHILSQDQITNFINSENPKERYQNVLSIMGIENKILIDNLKDINIKLNHKIEDLERLIVDNNEKQKDILKNKKEINIELIIKKLKSLNIQEVKVDHIISLLKKNSYIDNNSIDNTVIDKLKLEIRDCQSQLTLINKIEKEKYNNIKNFTDENDKTLEESNNLKYEIKTKILDKGNLEKKLLEIKTKQKYFQQLIKVKEEIENKYSEIKKMKLMDEEIKRYSSINRNLEFLLYAKKYKPVIEKYKIKVERHIEEKRKLEVEIDENIKMQQEDKQLVIKIENDLLKNNSENLIDMIDSLEKIKTSLIKKDNVDFCPVCNSFINDKNIIQEIDKNIDYYKKIAFKLEGMVKELILSKESLTEKISLVNSKLKILKSKVNIIDNNIEEFNIKIKDICENRLYKEELISTDIILIELEENKNREKINDISKYKKLKRQIEELEDKYKEDLELLGDEPEDINDILKKFNENLSCQNKKIAELQALESKLEARIKNNNEIIYRLNKSILDEKSSIDIKQLIDELDKKVVYLNVKIKEIEDIQLNLKDYLFNKDKDEKTKELIKIKEAYSKRANLITKRVEEINSYVNELNTYSKDCIERYLNNSDSPVKKYYNYLNPMPIKQSLHFNTNNEDEKLLIEIKNNEKSTSRLANKTLSSGQLNVLALSIFLAMNEYQKMNDLKMVAIDDPIQNMDDINQFSVCDILGNIKTQLIFSTHDIEFLKLFLKKNSVNKGNMTIFNIESPYVTPNKVKIIENK